MTILVPNIRDSIIRADAQILPCNTVSRINCHTLSEVIELPTWKQHKIEQPSCWELPRYLPTFYFDFN